MKRCPECRRDYYDDTLLYCLDDGNALLEGPASADEPATAILHTTDGVGEAPTRNLGESDLSQLREQVPDFRPTRLRRVHKGVWLGIGLLIAAAAGTYTVYRVANIGTVSQHFQNIKLTRLTTEGSVESSTISPDGKYLAYTLEESGRRSLWTKHLATESRIQIAPPVESMAMYASTFSPDGSYVYYTRVDDENPKGAVYLVPVLGGASKKIVENVSQPVSISPDGKQIAFGRFHLNAPESDIFIANADGTDEVHLLKVKEPDYLTGASLAWSPDGKMIAFGYGSSAPGTAPSENNYGMTVATVALADKTLKSISSRSWPVIGNMAWLRDGSGVVFVVRENRSQSQLWHYSVPTGEARRITADLNSYDLLSLMVTADSKSLVAVQSDPVSQIWVAPTGDTSRPLAISSRKNVQDGRHGLAWTQDGKIVFDTAADANSSIWSVNADGTDAKALTDGSADDFAPEMSPDGRSVFFGRSRNGFQIWRMDIDGRNPKQLTNNEGSPTYSVLPDGQWVIYNPYNGGIYKIPAAGGDPIKIVSGGALVYPQVSPDGQLLAYFYTDGETKRPKIGVVRFNNAAPLKSFDLPISSQTAYLESLFYRGFHWSPDGSGLVYINTLGGVSNLWRQPLDGGPAKKITEFKSDLIYNFAYSRDGKMLAFARGNNSPDAVLITEAK